MTRILLIENDAVDAELFRRALDKTGLRCQLTFCADESDVESLIEQPPDLIFLDNFLNRMTGAQMLEKLRALGYEGPVVVVTGLMEGCGQSRLSSLGCETFIEKDDISSDVLKGAIERVLARRCLPA